MPVQEGTPYTEPHLSRLPALEHLPPSDLGADELHGSTRPPRRQRLGKTTAMRQVFCQQHGKATLYNFINHKVKFNV